MEPLAETQRRGDLLGVFAKQPVPGECKTRLAARMGNEAAAEVARAFLLDTVERFATVGDRRCVAYAPRTEVARSAFGKVCGGRYELWPQPDGSLGERLGAFVEQGLAAESRVVIIGTDSPTLPVELVRRAFELLDERDCVLGPATDGGFCLIGLRRWEPGLLDGVEWSSSRVLSQVVGRLEAHGFSLGLLPPWYDVDRWDDLCLLSGHLAAMRLAGAGGDVPNTIRVLSRLGRGVDGWEL